VCQLLGEKVQVSVAQCSSRRMAAQYVGTGLTYWSSLGNWKLCNVLHYINFLLLGTCYQFLTTNPSFLHVCQ